MKRIGIITNSHKDADLSYANELKNLITANGGSVGFVLSLTRQHFIDASIKELAKSSDIIISLGGDGTFLKAARATYENNIPLLGINLGNLGFLTEVDRNDIEKTVIELLNDKFEIDERMMIEANVYRNGELLFQDNALNDVVISRGALSRIIHIKTYLNDDFIDNFPGDGLIISTPTGSTAYSLSAGGPIVEPSAEIITLTPICPHTLHFRSFITDSNKTVRNVIDESAEHKAMVTFDGQTGIEVIGGDEIVINKSKHKIRVIRTTRKNFYYVLRTKIHDRGERLRGDEI